MSQVNMPPRPRKPLDDGIEKPKRLKELPSYISKVVGGFFSRLFYIISLCLEAKPSMFVLLVALCLVEGFVPVFGAYVSALLIDEVAEMILLARVSALPDEAVKVLQPLILPSSSIFCCESLLPEYEPSSQISQASLSAITSE